MINLDKMKEKLGNLENSGGSGLNFYKPSEGQQDTIRLLPAADGDPFVEKWMHYNVGRESFECPKRMHGDDCPVCGFVDQLWSEYNETKDDETREAASQLKAKARYYSLVIDRAEPATVKIWSYSKTVCQELLNYVLNPDYGDITEAKTGNDIKISVSKKNGQKYPSTDLQPRPVKTTLLDSDTEMEALIASAPDVHSVTSTKTFDEIAESLQSYFQSMDVGELDKKAAEKGSVNETLDIDDMFTELQNELSDG